MSRLALPLVALLLVPQGGRFGNQGARPGSPFGGATERPGANAPRTLPRKAGPSAPLDPKRDPYLRGFNKRPLELSLESDRDSADQRGGLRARDPLALVSPERLPEVYFEAADQDRDGWMSYREGRDAFDLDRDAYLVWDKSGDGRVTYEEFLARYRAVLERGGLFTPPASLSARAAAPPSPEDLLHGFDEDANQRLSLREVARVLKREEIEIDASLVIDGLDRDGSRDLGIDELPPLIEVLLGGTAEAERRFERHPTTIEELVARTEPRETGLDRMPEPRRVVGPVTPLRRLDLAGDGWIDADDLRELQRPLSLPVRLQTIVAALDADGDGRLSVEELHASMR